MIIAARQPVLYSTESVSFVANVWFVHYTIFCVFHCFYGHGIVLCRHRQTCKSHRNSVSITHCVHCIRLLLDRSRSALGSKCVQWGPTKQCMCVANAKWLQAIGFGLTSVQRIFTRLHQDCKWNYRLFPSFSLVILFVCNSLKSIKTAGLIY